MSTVPVVDDQRAVIAAAITAADVPGITAYPQQPSTISAGDAWPVWQFDEFPTPCLTTSTYAVFVALPSVDFTTAIEATGGLRTQVPAALEAGVPAAVVTRAEPAFLTVADKGGTVPALWFTLVIG